MKALLSGVAIGWIVLAYVGYAVTKDVRALQIDILVAIFWAIMYVGTERDK